MKRAHVPARGRRLTRSVATAEYEKLRTRLIAARRAAAYTQVALARKLRRPQSFVSKYERGERRLDLLEFLEVLRALGVDAYRFLREFGVKRLRAPRRTS